VLQAVGGCADGTPWPIGWVIALSGLGAAACAWLLLPGAGAPVTAATQPPPP
jgi:DHA1 family bicyclomycin/chloramphenicol resistance-like MFS transporter